MTRVGYAFLLLTGLLFQLLAMSEWVATKLINYGVFKCKGEGPEGSSGFSLDSMKQAIKQVIPGFESGEETSKNDFLDDLEDSIESGANTLEDLYAVGVCKFPKAWLQKPGSKNPAQKVYFKNYNPNLPSRKAYQIKMSIPNASMKPPTSLSTE